MLSTPDQPIEKKIPRAPVKAASSSRNNGTIPRSLAEDFEKAAESSDDDFYQDEIATENNTDVKITTLSISFTFELVNDGSVATRIRNRANDFYDNALNNYHQYIVSNTYSITSNDRVEK